MWEKASEWKQLRDGCPFQLVRDSTTHEQTHLDFVNQHRFHIRKEQILLFKNWLYRDDTQSASEFHWTLTLLTAKILSAELATVVYSKKSSPLLYLETLSRWKWKMKIWENCNVKGRWPKTNVYHIKYADWHRQSAAGRHPLFAPLYYVREWMANSHSLIKSPFKLSANAYGVYIINKIILGCL